jgi:hypothetical protein
MWKEENAMNVSKPTRPADPLSDGAADLSEAMERAKRVFDDMGLSHTTADLIEGAKVILGTPDEENDL